MWDIYEAFTGLSGRLFWWRRGRGSQCDGCKRLQEQNDRLRAQLDMARTTGRALVWAEIVRLREQARIDGRELTDDEVRYITHAGTAFGLPMT